MTRHAPHSRSLRACLAVLAVVLGACSGGSHSRSATTSPPPIAASKNVKPLVLGRVDVESAGPAVKIDKKARAAMLAAAESYLDNAVYHPLDSGSLGDGYKNLFDASVRATATRHDLGALTDLVVGRATTYSASSRPVELAAFANAQGKIVYLATTLTTTLEITNTTGSINVQRNVELTFARPQSTWVVIGYRASVKRSTQRATTTSTAVSGTT